jgi:hypothetical protein
MAQMMSHPFEIKPSASTGTPDELMITWGNTPQGSVASIYLPAVASSDIIALANSMYGKHRLTASDPNTIQCPAGDVTLVPVPKGQGRYAGLLSVNLPATVGRGDMYTVAVRQLTLVSATIEPPPPPPPQPQIALQAKPALATTQRESFSWRQVLGAFQYTLTVTPSDQVLYPEERLLAWLKWRVGVTPPSSRWLPVLQRYLNLTEGRVLQLGGDPTGVLPSQTGNVPTTKPVPPGPPPRPPAGTCDFTGKVVAIHYDRFGDFCGFNILSEEGREHRFRGREHAMEELIRRAWTERTVISVLVEEHDRDWPVTVTLRRYH